VPSSLSAWRAPRALVVPVAAALVLLAGARAARQVRGSLWFGRAERAFHRPGVDVASAAAGALPPLERTRSLLPGAFSPWLHTAQAHARLGRFDDAASAARRALDLEPWSPNAWAALAAAELPGDPTAARASAEKARAILHDNPLALLTLAQAAAAMGDPRGTAVASSELRALPDARALDRRTADAARDMIPYLPAERN
jgi:tetratricopeptide (TPR) repeat protein